MIHMILNKIDGKKVKVLTGREKGEEQRKESNFDSIDSNNELVTIDIPNYIYSINSSYFLGLFGESIRKLGKDAFKNKYIFNCDDILMQNIENGINDALKINNILGSFNEQKNIQ